jgi:drug/metabolite transporter (DMT)-like permease
MTKTIRERNKAAAKALGLYLIVLMIFGLLGAAIAFIVWVDTISHLGALIATVVLLALVIGILAWSTDA